MGQRLINRRASVPRDNYDSLWYFQLAGSGTPNPGRMRRRRREKRPARNSHPRAALIDATDHGNGKRDTEGGGKPADNPFHKLVFVDASLFTVNRLLVLLLIFSPRYSAGRE